MEKTLSCLQNMYLEVAAQSSSTKKVFLKLFQNLEGTFARVSFSKKFQVRDLQLYEKGTPAQVLPSKFSKTSKINYFVKHLGTAASVYRRISIFTRLSQLLLE